MQQQLLWDGIVRCAEVFGQSCLADTTTWLEDSDAGLCAERDGRRFKITQPNLKYETERGCCQVGMVYCRDGTYLCASTENIVHDSSSWYRGEILRRTNSGMRQHVLLFPTKSIIAALASSRVKSAQSKGARHSLKRHKENKDVVVSRQGGWTTMRGNRVSTPEYQLGRP